MIPKILHQVWVGDNPIPPVLLNFRRHWIDLHPNWQHVLWKNADIPDLKIPADLLERVKSLPITCLPNIVRLFAVFQYGGVYSDLDVDPIRNIDFLLETPGPFAAVEWIGEAYGKPYTSYSNAIYGSPRRHPFIQFQIDHIPMALDYPTPWGPPLLTIGVEAMVNSNIPINLLGKECFCPYVWGEGPFPTSNFPNSYGVHHWALSWGKDARVEKIAECNSIPPQKSDSAAV